MLSAHAYQGYYALRTVHGNPANRIVAGMRLGTAVRALVTGAGTTALVATAAMAVAAIALTACGGSGTATPAAAPPATPSAAAHQAAPTCKQSYDAWKTGPAVKAATAKLESALRKTQSAGSDDDITLLQSSLESAGHAAQELAAYPMPSCADPKGYWPKMLALLRASGDNAKTSSGLSALILAEAPLQKVPAVEARLTAELKKDVKASKV